MKAMAKKMEEGLQGSEKEQMEEDVKMLRQVLDNLLAFLYRRNMRWYNSRISKEVLRLSIKNIKLQQDLKLQFKHVDDSLFALSLRNPKLLKTQRDWNVHYNIDKALVGLSDAYRKVYPSTIMRCLRPISGDFLSDILNNMQMSLSSMGSGNLNLVGVGRMQLPDIIKSSRAW
jgi:hypothetical protein